jgi:hypothetical protein
MVQGSDIGKHETQNAMPVAQHDTASIARFLHAIATPPECCL